jgi:methylated-DNA-[protein]-cysteine S-methyltransferase
MTNHRSIRTATFDSPLGPLLLTEEGGALTALDWATHACAQTQPLTEPTPLLRRACAALDRYFAGTLSVFDLPCAPKGTPFQRRVWAEMARIPYGATLTYGELAQRIGSSARAVGNACGANPLPIIVPCHRVLAARGGLGGYSGFGGAATKEWLLAHEACGRAASLGPGETRNNRYLRAWTHKCAAKGGSQQA